MKQHIQVLEQALNKATTLGAFTLKEAGMVDNSLSALKHEFAKGSLDKAIEEMKDNNLVEQTKEATEQGDNHAVVAGND